MKNFQLKEFTTSDTAIRKGINNTPSSIEIAHITELVDKLLDPLRDAWAIYCSQRKLGTPALKVNSGFRCKALNTAVGGAKTSAHLTGYAADIYPMNGNIKTFISFTNDWIKNKAFDQCIDEYGRWCHIGIRNNNGLQRKQIFKIR